MVAKGFRLTWQSPGKSPVVIYDRAGEGVLKQLVSAEIEPVVLDTRDVLYLTPQIVLHSLLLLIIKRWRNSPLWRKASVRVCYEFALIASVKPRVVINHSEANIRFGLLSRLCYFADFLGIQNGYRQSEINANAHLNYLTNAFCFGQEVVDNYKNARAQIGCYSILGSLSNGLYQECKSGEPEWPQSDICLISQYRSNRFDRETKEIETITKILLNFLLKYCEAEKKSCVIAGNAKQGIEANKEIEFYGKWIDSDCIGFLPNDRSKYSTYRAIDASEVAICVNSTAGIEALGRGAKILFCNYSSNKFYDLQGAFKNGIWAMSNEKVTYRQFHHRLSDLLSLSKEEWINVSTEFAQYFIFADRDRLPQNILRKHISDILRYNI